MNGTITIDKRDLIDESIAPWDVVGEPDGPVADWTPEELRYVANGITAVFLGRRGHDVEAVSATKAGVHGCEILTRDRDTGTLVLTKVVATVEPEDAFFIPSLNVSREDQRIFRDDLAELLKDYPEDNEARADVVSFSLQGRRTARVRHLMGAAWAER